MKHVEKRLSGNYSRMLHAVLNKFWKQHSTKQQLYSHSPLILQTIQVRQTRYIGYCWRSKDEHINNVFLLTLTQGCSSVGWPVRIYMHLLCVDTGCNLEDMPRVMDDMDRWWARELHEINTTWWWWWWWWIYINNKSFILLLFNV